MKPITLNKSMNEGFVLIYTGTNRNVKSVAVYELNEHYWVCHGQRTSTFSLSNCDIIREVSKPEWTVNAMIPKNAISDHIRKSEAFLLDKRESLKQVIDYL